LTNTVCKPPSAIHLAGVPLENTTSSANSLKTLQNGLKHRETAKNAEESKVGQFYRRTLDFRYLKETRKVPIQTLVSRNFVTTPLEGKTFHLYYINYFLSYRTQLAACVLLKSPTQLDYSSFVAKNRSLHKHYISSEN